MQKNKTSFASIAKVGVAFCCWMVSVFAQGRDLPVSHSKEATNANVMATPTMAMTSVQVATNPHLRPADIKPLLGRILEATLECGENQAAVKTDVSSMKSLARTLSALQPTLVSGLVKVPDEGPLRTSQNETFLAMRKEVLVANSRCKFDVTINASKYSTAAEFLSRLQEINAKLMPDVLHIVIPANNEVVYPSVLARGIEFAHAHGELVSYEGPSSMIPDSVDLIIVRAWNGEIHREEINNLKTRHRIPIVVQVPAITEIESQHAVAFLTHLAEEQAPFGYHLAYPINTHQLTSTKDASLLVTLRALMTRFN